MRLVILARFGRGRRWVGMLPASTRYTAGTRPGWARRVVLWLDRQIARAARDATADRLAGRGDPGRW